jgi:lycopene cyclase domain-containing protein
MDAMKAAYLLCLLVAWAGVLVLDRRLRLGIVGRRLGLVVVATVPVFLGFDAIGAAQGWFFSNPARNVAIFPPGIPLEEPILLGFLCLLSIALYRLAGRALDRYR